MAARASQHGWLNTGIVRTLPLRLGSMRPSLVVVTSLLAYQISDGQEPSAPEVPDLVTIEVDQEPLEEITVIGEQSLRSMFAAVVDAQENAFELFNSLNDDENYRIECRRERPEKDAFNPMANTWRVRVCRTRFMSRASARETEDFLRGFGDGESSLEIQRHLESFNQKLNELAASSPELDRAIVEWRSLRAEYDQERAKRMNR